MKKLLVAFCTLFLLSGCHHQKKDAIYYIHHANELKSIISTCNMMGLLAADSAQCIDAAQVYQQLVTLSNELLSDPQQFGQKILSNQTKLAQLQEKLKQNPTLSDQYTALKEETATRIALVGQAEAPEGL